MTSKYDTYWQDRLVAILALFEQARTSGASASLPLTGLDALGERGSWYGKLEIVAGQSVYDSAAHLAALGAILTPSLPGWSRAYAWIVAVSKELQLTVEKTEPQKTNWFENAYRVAKQDETIRRAAAYLGPLTQETEGSAMCRTAASKPVYVLFTAQRDRWLAPRRARLETAAGEEGDVVISLTDEVSGRFDLWIIPAAELVAAIQKAGFAPSLDRGNAYNFNLQTNEASDLIRQLNWDIRPYRRESGQTELMRAAFWPAGGPPPPGEALTPVNTAGKVDVAARLAQWKLEATDPNHPNHYHADLDEPARVYAQITASLRTLRDEPEAFGRNDVAALFGALNSGKRMKNKVADGNPLPELRAALLALVDGEGEATTKIATAASTIKFAHNNMLGELYGWANAEMAPLYNSCARDALTYLGYPFDLEDYNAFVAAHEQFKQVYQAQVARLRPELPLNLEIDKLYNVIDKVDLKQKHPVLAKPFSEMFADWEEAEWAFDLLGEAAQRLGVAGPDDPLAAWTLRRTAGQYHLHFSYGRWLVLGLAGADGHLTLKLALFRDRLDLPTTRIEPFSQKEGETPVSLHYLAAQVWRQLEDSEQAIYAQTLDQIKQLFAGWQASPYHKYTNTTLAQAVFDPDIRRRLLKDGMKTPTQRFWKIAPGDDAWQWSECRDSGFIAIGWDELGDLSNLDRAGFEARRAETQQEHPDWTNDALEQVWKFAQIQEGDRIVANRGTTEVLGIGTVTGPYYFVPGVRHGHRLPVQWDDMTVREVNEGGWRRTLVELTEAKFSALAAATPSASNSGESVTGTGHPEAEGDGQPERTIQAAYPLPQFAAETGFPEEELAGWARAIERKGQAILYGPPGTGKTFVAERLARHLVGGGDGFWDLVQFHPAYAYEDFIQGIRPRTTAGGGLSYPTEPGRFLEFCTRAANCQGRCVLIIDEINRANLARVFGELMYLLEYRDQDVPLAGGGRLRIPANVRLIGTMNTADRSIALVDHALRRRFAFLALYPHFDALRDFHRRQNTGYPVEKLIQVLNRLNSAIHDRHYHVGITYFLRQALATEIADIWRMEIEPYLDEYFFDQPDKADAFRWERVQTDLQP